MLLVLTEMQRLPGTPFPPTADLNADLFIIQGIGKRLA